MASATVKMMFTELDKELVKLPAADEKFKMAIMALQYDNDRYFDYLDIPEHLHKYCEMYKYIRVDPKYNTTSSDILQNNCCIM
jgi:hypothetical protein